MGSGIEDTARHRCHGQYVRLLTLPDRVLVLNAFQRKTQQTSRHDIDLAVARLKAWRT